MTGSSHGQRIGYVRVSSLEQNPQRQLEELNQSGKLDRVFQDKASGSRRGKHRPQLDACIAYLRDGDELVVSSIDRLARSLIDLRSIIDALTDKGVTVIFLHEHLSFSRSSKDPRADLMLGILGSFAEFERAIIRERQAEGIALAKKAGKYKGRRRALAKRQEQEVQERAARGESKSALAREYGVARGTIYAAIKRNNDYGN